MMLNAIYLTPSYRCFCTFIAMGFLFASLLSVSTAYGNTSLVPQTLETPEGYSFWYLQTPNSPVTSLAVHYPASSLNLTLADNIPNKAIGNIAMSLFPHRNQRFNPKESALILEQNHASISMHITDYGTKIDMSFITSTKDELSQLYRASIHEPSFISDDIEFAKNSSLDQLENELKDPDSRLLRSLAIALFGDSIWGSASFIKSSHIRAITASHLVAFHRQWYQTKPWVIALTSMSADDTAAYIDNILHNKELVHSPNIPLPEAKINSKAFGTYISLQDNNLEQAIIMASMPGLQLNHPDHYALLVLTKILEKEYLYPIIRRQEGLAYHVEAFPHTYPNGGLVFIQTATAHQQAQKVISIIKDAIANIKETPIKQQIIDETVTGLINSSSLFLDTNYQIVSSFYDFRVKGQKADTLLRLKEILSSITSKRLHNLALKLWKDSPLLFAIIAP